MKRKIGWYVNRIRQMDAQEIAWRLKSEIRDVADIGRVQFGLLPTTKGPLPSPAFSLIAQNIDAYRNALSAEQLDALVHHADQLANHQLSYFGRTESLGTPVNWHRDWHTGVQSPLKHCYFVDYRDSARFGDCKEVWEPNRHHQLVVLGRAYAATGDTRYSVKIADLLTSWLDANPFGYGMNWRSPLELGVRIINWVVALDLIRDSGSVSAALSARLHESAYRHCWELERKFSQGSSANNHLIGEAAGLFVAACYWFPEQTRWIQRAKEILNTEIERQSYPSGCTKEQALSYQFFVISFFTQCGIVGERSGHAFGERYWRTLQSQYRFLSQFQDFGEQLPFFGDKDDGYVLDLGAHTYDLAELASWSRWLAGDAVPGHAAGCLYFGPQPKSSYFERNTPSSKPGCTTLFEDAGYALLRSSGGAGAVCLFDAGPLGYGSMAAHGHADALHVAYSVGRRPILVDSGTYDYFTYPDQRRYFRTTAAHNTLRIAGQEQSEIAGPFMWNAHAESSLRLEPGARVPTAVGTLQRYAGVPSLDRCQRSVSLDPETGALTIVDEVTASEPVVVEQFFHLHPEVRVTASDSGYRLHTDGRSLHLAVSEHARSFLHTDGELAQYSNRYHEIQHGCCIRTELRVQGNVTLTTAIVPDVQGVGVAG